jgi:hypothetical protein
MTEISDSAMREMLAKTRDYSLVILKAGPRRQEPGVEKIIWEHVRRNFALRAEGLLRIVCPVTDGSDVRGLGIFATSVEETRRIMDGDPGVQAGIFTYDVHACRSFPGDSLGD